MCDTVHKTAEFNKKDRYQLNYFTLVSLNTRTCVWEQQQTADW